MNLYLLIKNHASFTILYYTASTYKSLHLLDYNGSFRRSKNSKRISNIPICIIEKILKGHCCGYLLFATSLTLPPAFSDSLTFVFLLSILWVELCRLCDC
jgi:hypothetical protein